MSAIYRYRDYISAIPSLALIVALVGIGFKEATKLAPAYDEPVEVALIDEADIPPPPPPEQPKPEIIPDPAQPQVEQVVAPTPEPIHTQQTITESAVVEQVKTTPLPPADAPKAPAEVAPPPPKPVGNPSGEGMYISKLRAYLEKVKRYPTGKEASLQRPEGKVEVWLIVTRDGKVLESDIEKSSGNMLLDRAAKDSLRRITSVEPFPEGTWDGRSNQRFTATITFIPPAAAEE